MSEKLQKVLARAGVGSRREMEKYIEANRVSVDGKVARLGDRVEPNQTIRVDGHIVKVEEPQERVCRVLMYHKPEGELCTRKDPEGRRTVFDRLPRIEGDRWIAIGRLDINTSGLLLFTNDGELANRVMHPSYEIEREYSVRVFGDVTKEAVRNLTKGVELDDGPARFHSVKPMGGEGINKWFNVTLSEGRNREVRRMWQSQGVEVSRLIRVRYGELELNKRLPQGGWEELELSKVNYLRKTVKLKPETQTKLSVDPIKRKDKRAKVNRIRKAVKKHNQRVQQQKKRR
ncbi:MULTISPECIES: 23S rRNA pseudouridine(2605) synthase RluB [Pseudoalteromonas]|uniref:Pseudouridine synthase n=1 Tax=Pseudoalteromonas ruthenica TaxID=151081 RepID=A0A0F4PX73_9GAMM|nr:MULTISPECIES: 23S rRNA pseudouridine(2605) synthase RluB [Pseudoalteromonas]KJY99668.1 ribosomal large subunit pseudouridine synthase B [Pseudoalteromonas ruthenica]KJZ00114.1 ribosomal large subunit pseudouridine synthase B [Pseudoalteromonas ruthenica]RZF80126.1 23S rRNA pseudouridine(2605) synthase RluB [Pseudoalteromonas sp. CO325X]TMO88176.1 23S rRNA pseudouridine(2605) synthase RluB [Pseudoalteromonas ruthenica]TMO93143.1 23S rRNA pseudouridine(2605) synthase RluB [Pseudoalteromonas r|tara:strand:+ start:70772 stop:71635 length:864 start_codon:yes stop_codon:yes gene_type:complete